VITLVKKFFEAIGRYFIQTDLLLLFITLAASAYGFVLVFSATHGSTRNVITQVIAIGLGIAGMIVLSKIDYHDIAHIWKILAVVGIILLFVPYIHPHTVKGSADLSWLDLGFITVQPAEFVKIIFVITFSKHYDMIKDELKSIKNVLLLALHALVPIAIITVEQDMGMALVFILMFVFMMFAGSVQLRYFAVIGVGVLIGAPVIWNLSKFKVQRMRIMSLFDPTNAKYSYYAQQQISGRSAIGSGEIWGYGLFHGPKTQSSLTSGLLPERQNDMIFAVAGEELGFVGCVLILVIFIILLVKLISDARKSKDTLGAMICIGIFSSFAVQMMINLGMVLVVLPVIGISLPFFSSGGSSLLSSFFAVGMALSVYMHRKNSMFTSQGRDLI
jgi:rod shape determining protein RodA